MASPDWWPSAPEVGLLDVRDGICAVSFINTTSGKVERFSEPAVLRCATDGSFTHWGRRASAWKGRLPEGLVREVFPTGWPVDPTVARWYLKKLTATYLAQKKGPCRIYLVEAHSKPWARQLWLETLEDSPFSPLGFLAPWQHDVFLAKSGQPEQALSPFLHFRLDDSQTFWQLISGGEVAGSGRDHSLSDTRLMTQMGEFLRRSCSVEVGAGALRTLVQASCREERPHSRDLALKVSGRQIYSGLPTRQTFSWSAFLATRPAIVAAWHGVKRRICAQAEQISGVASGREEGLDLPGWRVLTSGPAAHLFVEGPVVRLLDGL